MASPARRYTVRFQQFPLYDELDAGNPKGSRVSPRTAPDSPARQGPGSDASAPAAAVMQPGGSLSPQTQLVARCRAVTRAVRAAVRLEGQSRRATQSPTTSPVAEAEIAWSPPLMPPALPSPHAMHHTAPHSGARLTQRSRNSVALRQPSGNPGKQCSAQRMVERHREQFRRRLQEYEAVQAQALAVARYSDWGDLQQENELKVAQLRKELHLATEGAEALENENSALHHKLVVLEDAVAHLRDRANGGEEQLACYQMGGEALERFMAHFNYATADEAIYVSESMRRTLALREEQLEAYEGRHRALQEQAERQAEVAEARLGALTARLAEAEAGRQRAETQLKVAQRGLLEIEGRCRALAACDAECTALKAAIGDWHQDWMDRAKFWGYTSHGQPNQPLALLAELRHLADSFLPARVAVLYQDVCKFATKVSLEYFAGDPSHRMDPLKTFEKLYASMEQQKAEVAGLQRQMATAMGSFCFSDAELAEHRARPVNDAPVAAPEVVGPADLAPPAREEAVQSAVKLLQRRRQRVGSQLELGDTMVIHSLTQIL